MAVGIPADLLRRRPDVRSAERQVAAQSAQIGIAEAQYYPLISVNGTFGYSAANFSNLFQPQALAGSVGPGFTWNILNYGRIANNVHLQDARFQELIATYRNTVLQRQPGRGERPGDVPERAAAGEVAGGKRRQCQARRGHRAGPIRGRHDRPDPRDLAGSRTWWAWKTLWRRLRARLGRA